MYIYPVLAPWIVREREGERVSGAVKIYTRFRKVISRDPSSSFCHHEAGTSQFPTESSARFSYFLLWSSSLSTLASLYIKTFLFLLKQGRLALRRASAQGSVTSGVSSVLLCSLPTSPGSKTSVVLYFSVIHTPRSYTSFWHPTHAIPVVFLISSVYPKRQVHPVVYTYYIVVSVNPEFHAFCIRQTQWRFSKKNPPPKKND